MPANTRARTPLRAALNVETLEGRAVPAVLLGRAVNGDPVLAAPPAVDPNSFRVPLGAPALAHGQSVVRVVSQVFVNGELVTKVKGKPQFAAIGPALSTDESGNPVEGGGTTVFVNGTAVGTFAGNPAVNRDNPMFVQNKHGQFVKVVNYHITGTPYLAPPTAADDWHAAVGGAWVG
jgi:hypothetical protein